MCKARPSLPPRHLAATSRLQQPPCHALSLPPGGRRLAGAYKGRGRGNAFLADLCDADALIHVVDASGTTDAAGGAARPGEGADPRADVAWVREEIHRWVFANVAAKWGAVLRRPVKLAELFSGYHAPRCRGRGGGDRTVGRPRPDAEAGRAAGCRHGPTAAP